MFPLISATLQGDGASRMHAYSAAELAGLAYLSINVSKMGFVAAQNDLSEGGAWTNSTVVPGVELARSRARAAPAWRRPLAARPCRYGRTTTVPTMPSPSWMVQMYRKVPGAVNLIEIRVV